MIYCEQLADGQPDNEESGFRYSYGNGLGNAFWELSAQWQSWQGYYDAVLYDTDDGWQQIGYANTPEANGFSVVRLPSPENGRINILFEGIQPGAALASDDSGECRSEDNVEDNIYTENDGSRKYSPMQSGAYGNIEYVIPENTELLYLVVLGMSDVYVSHIWDNTERTDVQMRYMVSVG